MHLLHERNKITPKYHRIFVKHLKNPWCFTRCWADVQYSLSCSQILVHFNQSITVKASHGENGVLPTNSKTSRHVYPTSEILLTVKDQYKSGQIVKQPKWRNRITLKMHTGSFILLTTKPTFTWVWEGGKPFRPYTPINASFWREILNFRNCGWSIKSCDLQKTPGGTSWIALRPISSSPESMVLFSCVNPPNFPEWKRSSEGQKIKAATEHKQPAFQKVLCAQRRSDSSSSSHNEILSYNVRFKNFLVRCCEFNQHILEGT